MKDTGRAPPYHPGIAKGWWVAFLVIGSLLALDGAWGLAAGERGMASIVESIGQLIAGPLLAAHGALGRRNGRGLRGWRFHAVLVVGTCLYLGGMISGGVEWSSMLQ